MSAQTATIIAVISVLVAVASLLINSRLAWSRELREQGEHTASEADRTIALIKDQNTLLYEQNEEFKRVAAGREKEWREREREWRQERDELKVRLKELEGDYRTLVLTITTMRLCTKAAACPDYNPGDRRVGESPGRTD